MQKAGIEKKSPVLRSAPIKLKFSGYIIIGVGTLNPLLEFSNSTLICSYSLYKLQIDSPGPHGQPERCSNHEGFRTLSFFLSGSTTLKTAKRNRLRRETEKKNRSGLQREKKRGNSKRLFLMSFSTSYLDDSERTKNAFFAFVFFHGGERIPTLAWNPSLAVKFFIIHEIRTFLVKCVVGNYL